MLLLPPQGEPEDLLFFYSHLRKGGGVIRVDQSLLLYRYHPNAATHSVLEYVRPRVPDLVWGPRGARVEHEGLRSRVKGEGLGSRSRSRVEHEGPGARVKREGLGSGERPGARVEGAGMAKVEARISGVDTGHLGWVSTPGERGRCGYTESVAFMGESRPRVCGCAFPRMKATSVPFFTVR